MIMIRIIILIIVLLTLNSTSAISQVRYRIAAGLSTDWITNDNAATYRITGSSDDPQEGDGYGGGFDGVQMGWGIKAFADLDKQKLYRIPFSFDYWIYQGVQAVNGERFAVNVKHEVNLISTGLGFEWSFIEFPLAYARAYIGAEARYTYVTPNTITFTTRTVTDSNGVNSYTEVFDGKEAVGRLGAMARLGIEGEILYPVFLNTSVAWGAMNLIGRDMTPTSQGGRGELLTPRSLNEAYEGIVQHLNFTFMVQVRI